MLCVVVTVKTYFRLGCYNLNLKKKKKNVYKDMYLFPRCSDRVNEREGGGNGCVLSDQSPLSL